MHDLHRGVGAELPHCVKNKFQSQSSLRERFGDSKHGFKICFGALLAQNHYADRKRNFCVDDVLCQQIFAEIVQDEREVLRVTDKRSDPLESFEEAGEIFVSVLLADLRFGEDDAVTAR